MSPLPNSLVFAFAVAAALSVGCDDEPNPTRLPTLASVTALPATDVVSVTAWLRLDFDDELPAGAADVVALNCGGNTPSTPITPIIDVDLFGPRTLVVNPVGELPAGANCELSWPGPDDIVRIAFAVASDIPPALVPYDRNDPDELAPFPDDYFRAKDAGSVTGFRLAIPAPERSADGRTVVGSFTAMVDSDGFSPVTAIVVPLPGPAAAKSIPLTSAESLDPFATVGLFDVAPESATYGQRMPFFASVRTDIDPDGSATHHLLMFPAEPLQSLGRYAVVVSRRALDDGDGPFTPSPYSRKALGIDAAESVAEVRGAAILEPVLDALENAVSPPIRRDDIALALRITIRDTRNFARDRLAIRRRTMELPPPSFVINSVSDSSNPDIGAVVVGTWKAPVWNDGHYLRRDGDGLPTSEGTQEVPFILQIPQSAAARPVPITMYQHGTPASLGREMAWAAASLTGAGEQDFAVIGFTDLLNRETEGLMLSAPLYQDILDNGKFPDIIYTTTFAEQLSFIRLIRTLGAVDVLPRGAPDGIPDLDVSAPLTYLGVSHGSITGVGLLPYAPEIRAAALVTGGGNYAGILAHQSKFVREISYVDYPELTWSELYVTFPLMQIPFDAQDPLNHARFMYAEPHDLGDPARASILMSEGVGDSFVPSWSTESAAACLQIPLLTPAPRSAPFLESVNNAVVGNINSTTTAALTQYVPIGIEGMPPTPGCADNDQDEGHFCPQSAAEAFSQRLQFLTSALNDEAPTIKSYDGSTQSGARAQPDMPIVTSVSPVW